MSKKISPSEPLPAGASAPAGEGERSAVSAQPQTVLTGAARPASSASANQTAATPSGGGASGTAAARLLVRGKPGRRGRRLGWVLLVLAVAAALVLAWFARASFEQIRADANARSDALAAALAAVQRDASEARAAARAQADAVAQLQRALMQTQAQLQTVQATMQTQAAAPDRWADADETLRANDIEQLLQQAGQQLRLGGHVANAIVALEIAQSRLLLAPDGVERPEQMLLRQALEDDLSRLRAVAMVDVAALAAQLDRLVALTARAPLLVADLLTDGATGTTSGAVSASASPGNEPRQPGDSAAAATAPADDTDEANAADASPTAPWWQRAGHSVAAWSARSASALGRDLRGLVSVQRVADPNALLLAPDQAAQLRAALRLRLLTAQVALLLRQATVWESELTQVDAALASYYDGHAAETQTARRLARELLDAALTTRLPDVTASVKALAVLRAALAYAPRGAADEAAARDGGSD